MLNKPELAGSDRTRLVNAAYPRVRDQFSSGARRRRIAELYEMLVPGSQQFDAWTTRPSSEAIK